MEEKILCLNGGSSSLKFAVYPMAGGEERLFSGAVEAIGTDEGRVWVRGTERENLSEHPGRFPDQAAAIKTMFAALAKQGVKDLAAAGHRLVHGGPDFTAPRRIDEQLRAALEALVPFAPLHLPSQLAMIRAVAEHYPDLPQVACFDTAFHCRMPMVAQRFPLAEKFWNKGIRRYGFHGLSYEFVTAKLGQELGARAIIAHLGNGASMVALRDGASVDTSMGLTPTGGFMMGTRSGDLDPGVVLCLLQQGYSNDQLEDLLNHQAGLKGVSGQGSEMKTLLDERAGNPSAALAVEMFCYQARKFIGAFAAVLGGLDTLVFTGGIGEHAAVVRAEICRGLEHLGIALDERANEKNGDVVSQSNSVCKVRVVQTDEDLMIARHTRAVTRAPTSG